MTLFHGATYVQGEALPLANSSSRVGEIGPVALDLEVAAMEFDHRTEETEHSDSRATFCRGKRLSLCPARETLFP
ncbi:MAG: hypothetical protein CVU57_20415 [Deltaproteobacteria bacterium HGW-Deltaproteobacteria-15]|jgi:hypothetical protein|nr:MAG: hypothetical protein CVU57_20415 [Deltaproteobacteria bacterium HGW-Deltaproteobacteria-15]